MTTPDGAPGVSALAIELCREQDGVLYRTALRVPADCTIAQALAQAVREGLLEPGQLAQAGVSVFGRLRKPDDRLHDGDRIELTGPLLVDPKVARARRVAHRRAAEERSRWRPQGR